MDQTTVPNTPPKAAHQTAPLITPEIVVSNPTQAFAIVPRWARLLEVLYPGSTPSSWSPVAPVIVVMVGTKRLAENGLSGFGYVALWELTRIPGISIVTNSDGKGRDYTRITFEGAPEDLTTVKRFLFDAGPYDQMKTVGSPQSDMRSDNLTAIPASRMGKYARDVVLYHAERLAREWEQSGRMPDTLTTETYLANLKRLLAAVDAEAEGLDQMEVLTRIGAEH